MELIIFFETLAFAGAIALIAVVYRYILLREPVLHWFYRFGERYEHRWFFNPIWGCHKCIAGQLALWGYIYLHWHSYALIPHILAICAAIQFSNILTKELDRWN